MSTAMLSDEPLLTDTQVQFLRWELTHDMQELLYAASIAMTEGIVTARSTEGGNGTGGGGREKDVINLHAYQVRAEFIKMIEKWCGVVSMNCPEPLYDSNDEFIGTKPVGFPVKRTVVDGAAWIAEHADWLACFQPNTETHEGSGVDAYWDLIDAVSALRSVVGEKKSVVQTVIESGEAVPMSVPLIIHTLTNDGYDIKEDRIHTWSSRKRITPYLVGGKKHYLLSDVIALLEAGKKYQKAA